MRRIDRLRTSASIFCLLTAASAGHAVAQSAASPAPTSPAAAPAAAEAPVTVDQIVITAQKRVQSLQDVPIVVTAINHQLLQDTGVKDIKDLALLTPA